MRGSPATNAVSELVSTAASTRWTWSPSANVGVGSVPSAIARDQVDDLVGEPVLVAEQVAGRPPRTDVGVLGLGDEDPAEPGGRRRPRCRRRSGGRSCPRSRTRGCPREPLISMRIAFLRPVAKRVASKTPIAPPRNSREEGRRVVDGDRAALGAGRAGEAGVLAAGSGRSSTKVSQPAGDRAMVSPVMNWVRSMMWAPMSPSAPEPALSLSSRHDSGACGSTIQSWRYWARTWCSVADPALGDELPGEGDGRHAPVGEADHGAYAVARPRARRRAVIASASSTRVGQRLLAQHVLAGLEGGDGDLGVGVAGGADVDEVDVVALDQGLPRGLGGLPAEALGGGATPAGVTAGDGGHPRTQRQVEEAGGGAPGLGVGGAHEGVAHHADATACPARTVIGVSSCLVVGGARVAGRRDPAPRCGVDAGTRSRVDQDSKAESMYWSTLSEVTTGA